MRKPVNRGRTPLMLVSAAVVFAAGAMNLAAQTFAPATVVEAAPLQIDPATESRAPRGDESGGLSFDQHSQYDQSLPAEVEPNGTAAQANALTLTAGAARVRGNLVPGSDVDVYSFSGTAGDRVYATVMSGASTTGDVGLDVIGVDGTTVIEADENDGSLNTSAPSIAGTTLPASGTFYLRVRAGTGQAYPYQLFFQLRSGSPTPETEPNNNGTAPLGPPQLMPPSRWVSGAVDPATPAIDNDVYLIDLQPGDTLFASLDLNPERDAAQFNQVRLGIGLIGTPGTSIIVFNDTSAGSAANPLSEAYTFTAKVAGQYWVYIDASAAAGAGPTSTYHLSATVFAAVPATASCTTYTSTDVPKTIPTDLTAGVTPITSVITVPGNPIIADIDVEVDFTHTFMQDLDVQLVSPQGNNNGLFTDIGAATTGGPQTGMKIRFDDEAGLPPFATLSEPLWLTPEPQYRLSWFDGIDAGGTWTLEIRDDATGDGGTLNGWSITICEAPPPEPLVCPIGYQSTVAFSTDFETGDAGFTSGGTLNEWERGTPTFAPITTCGSGSNCFVTDLDGNYENSADQTLVSPAIDLTNFVGPVQVRFAQRFQLEPSHFDTYRVLLREAGGANPTEVYRYLGPDLFNTAGNPTQNIQGSAGWRTLDVAGDDYAGGPMEIAFQLTTDSSVPRAGVAIDDVEVLACEEMPQADLAITKTDGVATVSPGGSSTYTITASNVGPDGATGATVADTFPADLTCTWTCASAGGGSCTAAGSGNINDTVNLPAGGSVTYTAACTVAPTATGSIANTATVAAPSGVFDPTPGNNSATDTNTVIATAPEIDVSPASFSFTVTTGATDSAPMTIANSGNANLTWDVETDTIFGQPGGVAGGGLDEVLNVPNFSIASAANGGTPFVAVIPAGVATSGQVVGFSFQGTVAGITGSGSWASDMCLRVQGPDGATYDVGGFSTSIPGCAVNPWDFDGSGSSNDGTYASGHEDVFPFPPGAQDAGNWTFTFINGWDSTSAATMNWSNVTITLHKAVIPSACSSPNTVGWLAVDPDSGTTLPGQSSVPDVMIDATGLAVGTYEAFVCVNSNDADEGLVTVPVDLEVVAPSITVAPESIDAQVATAGQVATETLTIGNTGAGDLFWEIDEAPAGTVNPRDHFPRLPRQVRPGDGVASLTAQPVDAQWLHKQSLEVARGPADVSRSARGGGAPVPAYSTAGFSRADYVTMDALVPGSLTPIVDPAPATIFAQTFINDDFSQHFFIATGGGALAQNAYGYLDTATGAVNQLGVLTGVPAAGTWTSAKWDRTTGNVYAMIVPAAGTNQLYRIDVGTGVGTLVGNVSGGGLAANAIIIAIAVSPEGLMYGIEIQNDVLVAIDKTDGTPSVIGATGVAANFAQDMDFDAATGTLYWAGYQGSGNSQMFTVNTTTGAATAIGAVQDGAELLSFSVAVAGGNCSDPGSVPWLSVDVDSGTVPGMGTADEVEVTLDSTGLSDGLYEASLCVSSNDPARPLVEVPVAFTVGETDANLALSLFGVPTTVNAGGNVSLIATVANFGPAVATGVSVALQLPDDFSFVSGGLIEGSGNWSCGAAGQLVTCDLTSGSLPVGAFAAVLQVDVSVAGDAEGGVVTTTGIVSGDQVDPNPANNTATVDTTIISDVIFRNGFENAGGTPGVYTDRTTFLQNVLGGHFEEAFTSVPVGTAVPSLSFSGNGFAYDVTALGGGTNQLYNDPGIISHDSAVDAIRITFTGAPVTAIGGNFWGTDISFLPNNGQITLTLADGTTETYASTGPADFRGFVTLVPIAHITIDASDVPVNSWSTIDNVIAGAR